MPGEVTRSAPIYSDIQEKHVAVKGLAAGYVLEYQVRFRTIKPEVPGQFWFEETFIKDAIVKEERPEVNIPAAKYVKVASPDYKPVVREEGGRTIYTWWRTNLVVPEKRIRRRFHGAVPHRRRKSLRFRTWVEVGLWYGLLQKEPMEPTPIIQAKAAE